VIIRVSASTATLSAPAGTATAPDAPADSVVPDVPASFSQSPQFL